MNVIKGTGKTATFAINILQQVEANVQQCQALVLAPTRELAQQIVKVDELIRISPQVFIFVVTFQRLFNNLEIFCGLKYMRASVERSLEMTCEFCRKAYMS